MVFLRPPSNEAIRAFLESQANLGFTYEAVGATADAPPSGYVVDHTRIKLGEGDAVFARAAAALARWEQLRLGWVGAWAPDATIETGQLVAIVAYRLGLWWLNACRIVYVVNQQGPSGRYGYAYGTLPDHAGTGEERFLVEYDSATGAVWYDVLAFSRPNWRLTRLGRPYMRRLQRRFGAESAAAMRRAVGDLAAPQEASGPGANTQANALADASSTTMHSTTGGTRRP